MHDHDTPEMPPSAAERCPRQFRDWSDKELSGVPQCRTCVPTREAGRIEHAPTPSANSTTLCKHLIDRGAGRSEPRGSSRLVRARARGRGQRREDVW